MFCYNVVKFRSGSDWTEGVTDIVKTFAHEADARRYAEEKNDSSVLYDFEVWETEYEE